VTPVGDTLPASPPDAQARFERLQARLVPLWRSIESLSSEPQTIVVVPSISLDVPEGPMIPLRAYEERYLFMLLLLRQPRARLVYVTSEPILPNVVDYYLHLLPGVIPSHARPRLFTVPVLDGTHRPLTAKLLERPLLLERIRALIPDPTRAHLVPFNTTELERDLAVRLDIPMYGADPRHLRFGTKSGSRRVFADAGVPHPAGVEDVATLDDVVAAIVDIRASAGHRDEMIVKLNDGFSGEGNALVDLTAVPPPGSDGESDAVRAAVGRMAFEADGVTLAEFSTKLAERGGVVEERIQGAGFASPSVQLRVTPLGAVELLSTHDQLLGGTHGESYVGCVFPADARYADQITVEAQKVGRRLADAGVIGRFAVDFVTVEDDAGAWSAYAIEINLRKGGTTHPFLTLQFLTDGAYDPASATFTAPSGREKYFIASDRVESPAYRGLTPDDLFDIIVCHGLHFDHARQTGVVFHMMSALSEHGRVGMTAVGDSRDEARATFDRAGDVLDLAAAAIAERPLPDRDSG
jgi:hypothetical protein